MSEFGLPLDIMNRALDILGVRQLVSYTDVAPAVRAVGMYDKLRQFELRRNAWSFAIRREVLRPLSSTSLQITYPTWASGTTYAVGDIVAYAGQIWVSKQAANVGNTPGTLPTVVAPLAWDRFFGPVWCDQWSSSTSLGANGQASSGYNAGEMAYMLGAAGSSPTLYQSLENGNDDTPNVVDAWDSAVIYAAGAVVAFGGTNYQSLVNFNLDQQPPSASYWTTSVTNPTVSGSWRAVTGATLAVPIITWPIMVGPTNDSNTRNAYPLPNGYLRRVNQQPSAGKQSLFGAPTNLTQRDWEYEGGFIVSKDNVAINFRFGADVMDVTTFDPMFCEGLASALGLQLCEPLTQAPEKKAAAAQNYNRVMGEARLINAIEQGAEEPPLDDWLACRY